MGMLPPPPQPVTMHDDDMMYVYCTYSSFLTRYNECLVC